MTQTVQDIKVAAKSAFGTMVALIVGVIVPVTLGTVLGLGNLGAVNMSLPEPAPFSQSQHQAPHGAKAAAHTTDTASKSAR